MRILDINDIEIKEPNLELGYLKEDTFFIKHHEAVEEVQEQGHYEIVKEYPNGGRDAEWIIDVEYVAAAEAYDEYEDILRYIEYTKEELEAIEAEKNKPKPEERIVELEEALQLLLSGAVE